MTTATRRYKARIGNHQYVLVGPGSEEHFATVTALLNDRLAQIKALSPTLTDNEAAMLLAFNAVSDQVKLAAAQQQNAIKKG